MDTTSAPTTSYLSAQAADLADLANSLMAGDQEDYEEGQAIMEMADHLEQQAVISGLRQAADRAFQHGYIQTGVRLASQADDLQQAAA